MRISSDTPHYSSDVPTIHTIRFGALDYPEDAVIHFPAGIPAFDSFTRFLALERPDAAPLVFLQSIEENGPCFLTLPVHLLDPAYALAATPEDLELLDLPTDTQPEIGGNLACLAILTIPESRSPTANLMAPILIRRDTRRAVQTIQPGSRYSHQHPVFETSGAACS